MDVYKLRVYISGHTFEAEGDKSAVEQQFAVFSEMVNKTMAIAGLGQSLGPITPQYGLSKIIRVDDKIAFLTTLPETENQSGDAALILLLAHRVMFSKESIGGAQLLEGLKRSGIKAQRIDRCLGKYLGGTQALIVKSGLRRGVKYGLTEKGLSKAIQVSQQTSGTVYFNAKV